MTSAGLAGGMACLLLMLATTSMAAGQMSRLEDVLTDGSTGRRLQAVTADTLNSASGCNGYANPFKYSCSRQVSPGWGFLYTVSTDPTPPSNPCTNGKAVTAPLPSGATHWLHGMITTKTTNGWIAMSFPDVQGVMFPAKAILGGQSIAVNTYSLTEHFLPDADTPANSWAQNIATATTADGTMVCYSRPVKLATGLSSNGANGVLQLGDSLVVNIATGKDLSGHTFRVPGNAFSIATAGAPVPAPAPAPAPAPTPAPTPAPAPTPTPAASNTGSLTADNLNTAIGCDTYPNSFKYSCNRQLQQSIPDNAAPWGLLYTVSTSAVPPNNPCTGGSAVQGALPTGATHWMHIMVVTKGKADMWVGMSFPQTPGKMANADAVIGYKGTTGDVANAYKLTAVIQTETLALPSPDTTGWAKNINMYRAADGTTAVCFSRAVYIPSAATAPATGRKLLKNGVEDTPSSPAGPAPAPAPTGTTAPAATFPGVLTLASSSLDINVARGVGVPTGHSYRSAVVVPLTGGTVAAPAPASTPTPTPTPAGAASGSAVSTAILSPDALNKAAGCAATVSTYGYACSRSLTTGWDLAYTVSSSPVPPKNPCTNGAQTAAAANQLPAGANAWIHMMTTGQSQGWVAMSFAQDFKKMYPADAVLGGVDASGNVYVNTYQINTYSLPDPDAANNWAQNLGAISTADGRTAICFSRPVSIPGYTGSSTATSGRRLSQVSGSVLDVSQLLNLNIASNAADAAGTPAKHDFKTSVQLDMASGASEASAGEDLQKWVHTHGALMVTAFIALMPTAVLFARHRRFVPVVEVAGKAIWFWLHVMLQLVAVVLFIAGVSIALSKFRRDFSTIDLNTNLSTSTQNVHHSHYVIGVMLIALVGIQVLIGAIRPAPDAPKRWMWNMLHHNWGRVIAALAIVNVSTGVFLYKQWEYGKWQDLGVPFIVVAAVLITIAIALEVLSCLRPPAPDASKAPRMMDHANGSGDSTPSASSMPSAGVRVDIGAPQDGFKTYK